MLPVLGVERVKRQSLFIALGVLATTQPALACKFAQPQDNERQPLAEQTVRRASAIIRAVVVRPQLGNRPALLRAMHVYKGPVVRKTFAVLAQTSCDRFFTVKGQRARVLLTGGPTTYSAPQYVSAETDIDQAMATLGYR